MEASLKRRVFEFCHALCGAVPADDLYFRRDGGFWDFVAVGTSSVPELNCPHPLGRH